VLLLIYHGTRLDAFVERPLRTFTGLESVLTHPPPISSPSRRGVKQGRAEHVIIPKIDPGKTAVDGQLFRLLISIGNFLLGFGASPDGIFPFISRFCATNVVNELFGFAIRIGYASSIPWHTHVYELCRYTQLLLKGFKLKLSASPSKPAG